MDNTLMVVGRVLATLALIIIAWCATHLVVQALSRHPSSFFLSQYLVRSRLWRNGIRIFSVALATVLALHLFKPFTLPPLASAGGESLGTYQPGIALGTKNVSLGGGGYVTGIYLHPRQKDLVYIRTDVGGFYRWNPQSQEWLPLLEQFSRAQRNYFGGEAVALDPSDPKVIYTAVGKSHWYGTGTLLKSTNQGQTWTKLNLDLPLAEGYRRWVGERLAVNPFNSKALLFGAWKDGLWQSQDAGASWNRVKAFPKQGQAVNLSAIVFDPQTRGLVYAYVEGDGVYQSTDGGTTWSRMNGSPKSVMRMAIAGDHTLYTVGYESPLVAKLANGQWHDVSPPDSDPIFGAISINPTNAKEILVSRGEKNDPKMYRSTDAGATWTKLSRANTNTVPWWTDYMRNMAWVSAVEFDPQVPGRVWLTDWFGVWRTENINANPVNWTNYEKGHEEVVVLTLVSPPKGPLLLSGMVDVDGFVHDRGLDTYPSKNFRGRGPGFQDTYSIAYCEKNPLHLVRVSGDRYDGGRQGGATSSDGGMTWKPFPSFPENAFPTRVAMSATDPNLFVVTTSKGQPIRTTDGGKTWGAVSGLPDGAKGPWNLPPQSLTADTVDGKTFYYYSGEGKVYRSTDGGAAFAVMTDGLPGRSWHLLQARPGVSGEVWLSLDDAGLRRSTDGGKTFSRIKTVEQAYLFDFGIPESGSKVPTLYLYGKVSGQGEGIFRSRDQGATWSQVNAPNHTIGNEPVVLEASRQIPGLVFVGTGGRGIYYGSL